MSRGASARYDAGKNRGISAFEVEVECFWCDRLQRMSAWSRRTVYLTPGWILTVTPRAQNVEIGTYTKAVTLAAFREDCFHAIQQGSAG